MNLNDPQVREAGARAIAAEWPNESSHVADWHPDDRALYRDYSRWSDFTDRWAKITAQRQQRMWDRIAAEIGPLLDAVPDLRCPHPFPSPEFDIWQAGNRIGVASERRTWQQFAGVKYPQDLARFAGSEVEITTYDDAGRGERVWFDPATGKTRTTTAKTVELPEERNV